jgi:RecA-family ATPase
MDTKRRIIGEEPEQVKIDHEVQSEKGYYSARELYEMNIKEMPMLVNPIFLKSGLSVFAGSSDTGKSTFLRQLGLAIAKGDDTFLGWEIKAKHNRVIYVSTEDDRIAISYLLNKSLGDNADVEYLDNFTYIFNTSGLVDNLNAILSEKPADCVIIDAFTDIYGGDLNQSNRVREFFNQFFTLVDKYNCLFIFIHHTGKRTEEYPPNKNNLLGSQGIEGRARQVIELRRDPKDSQYRHLCLIKGNYIADDLKTKSFKMKFNEDLTYEMTDERVDFEELVFSQMDRNEYKREIAEKVIELRDSGNTFENISRLLADEGINISKSTAFNYYKKFKS